MKRCLLMLACAAALVLGISASASATPKVGSVANLRDAALTVASAEIHALGSTGCGKLWAPLAKKVDGKTCAQRWDTRSAALMAKPAASAGLYADYNAAPTAKVTIKGLYATIALPYPLLGGQSRFYWTDDCWMLLN